jgi:hypothetical protein
VSKCASRVNTRLRYVHKREVEIPGFPNLVRDYSSIQLTLEVFVVGVSTKLNVQNGESDTRSLVSGEALLKEIERLLDVSGI